MKKIFKNFTIIALAIFTILLSVGFNISKMKCAENKAIYLIMLKVVLLKNSLNY